MKSLFEQYQEEFHGIDYCCYCLEQKGNKWQCCHENHFVPFQDLDIQDQKEVIEGEIEFAKWQSEHQEKMYGR
jgi:hypothetical protein